MKGTPARSSSTLTIYFGDRDRAGGRFLADALVDVYERHRVTSSVMFRGIEGFGLHHTLHTQRILTLSEDLPLVSVAVDARAKIEQARRRALGRALPRLRARPLLRAAHMAKLTVHAAQQTKAGGRPLYVELIRQLRAAGAAGATVYRGSIGFYGDREPARDRLLSLRRDLPVHAVIIDTPEARAAVVAGT